MEKIKQDHKTQNKANVKNAWIVTAIIAPIAVLLSVMWVYELSTGAFYADVFIRNLLHTVVVGILIYVLIAAFCKAYLDNRDISGGRFKIVTDKVVSRKEITSDFGWFPHTYYYLEFASHGEYSIRLANNTFSDEYIMSDMGVYHSARKGETFYLVLGRKGKILLAYNTKFFELQD